MRASKPGARCQAAAASAQCPDNWAFRVEGDKWTCYYAMPGTMDGAIWMGSIMMTIVQDEDRRQVFMGVMKSALGEFLKHKFGEHPTWNEQAAPESERSGSA